MLSYSFDSGKELVKKWKALRDNFVRDHKLVTVTETGKAASKRKRYVFYDQLQFLLPYVKGNDNTSSNIQPITGSNGDAEEQDKDQAAIGDPERNQLDTEPVASTSTGLFASTPVGPSKRKPVKQTSRVSKKAAMESSVASSARDLALVLSESLALQKEERHEDAYGNKSFLMSLVPILNSLPLPTAMQARLHISQVLMEVAYNVPVPAPLNNTQSGNSTPVQNTPISESSSEDINISEYMNLH